MCLGHHTVLIYGPCAERQPHIKNAVMGIWPIQSSDCIPIKDYLASQYFTLQSLLSIVCGSRCHRIGGNSHLASGDNDFYYHAPIDRPLRNNLLDISLAHYTTNLSGL